MSNDIRQQIADLHRLYVELTGMEIRLDMAREHEWFTWLKRGFTPQDLRVLVAHLRRQIREGKRNAGALKFRNLICNVDYFEEDLAEARAMARRPSSDAGKASVLKATGRPAVPAASTSRNVGDILAGEKAFADFRKFKEQMFGNQP